MMVTTIANGSFFLVLIAVACGCGQVPAVAVLYGSEALRLLVDRPLHGRPIRCDGRSAMTTNDGVEATLECKDGHRRCGARLPVAVRNCSAQDLLVERLTFREDGEHPLMVVELDPPSVLKALEGKRGPGFVDRLILERYRATDAITLTFDRKLAAQEGAERLGR